MKEEIRKINKTRRGEMSREEVNKKSKAAADAFLASELYKNAFEIMVYIPLGNETDTSYIIDKIHDDGKKCIVPITNKETGEITPYYLKKNAELKKGAFSIYEPVGARKADKKELDIIIVPGIAFDKCGARVGFGKGCYDRFLKDVKVVKLGYCYDFQLSDEIPSKSHDIKMDFLVTESGLIECE